MLEGVVQRGTGRGAARYGVEGGVAGKTGTTDNYRDAWFVGLTTELAVAVWVGHDRGKSLTLGGGRAALPTFARFAMASGTTRGSFELPEGVQTVDVCTESYRPARPVCEDTFVEQVADGQNPGPRCDVHGAPIVSGLGDGIRSLFQRRRPVPESAEQGKPNN